MKINAIFGKQKNPTFNNMNVQREIEEIYTQEMREVWLPQESGNPIQPSIGPNPFGLHDVKNA